MMKSLIRLRILNAVDAFVFVIYGLLIHAYPAGLLNIIIVPIDLYYLVRMLKRSDFFNLMEVAPVSSYLKFFLNFHKTDIHNFFPHFSYDSQPGDMIFFILQDTIPADLVILRPERGQGRLLLNYALKDYHDFKIGSVTFDDNADILLTCGLNSLMTEGKVPFHSKHLRQMHFSRSEDGQFRRKLNPHFIRDLKL